MRITGWLLMVFAVILLYGPIADLVYGSTSDGYTIKIWMAIILDVSLSLWIFLYSQKLSSQKRTWPTSLKIFTGIAVWLIFSLIGSGLQDTAKTPETETTVEPSPTVRVRNQNEIIAAFSEVAYKELNQALVNGDQYGLDELRTAGLVGPISNGTSLLILGYYGPFNSTTIARVLEGPYAGKKIWIANNLVKK